MVWSERVHVYLQDVLFVKAFGLFCMIAYDCYEYEAFRFATQIKNSSLPHMILVSEDTQRSICVQHRVVQ